jgi:hypothetical protein
MPMRVDMQTLVSNSNFATEHLKHIKAMLVNICPAKTMCGAGVGSKVEEALSSGHLGVGECCLGLSLSSHGLNPLPTQASLRLRIIFTFLIFKSKF